MHQHKDTIAALATPSGTGAIAVLRLSGSEAFQIADRVFRSPGKQLIDQKGYTVHFGGIYKDDRLIDEVLATVFTAPHSYTGEAIVEISCHGSTYIQREILQLLLRSGARMAEPGEFTMRAFLNGKMDLSQAEAVADLISAENEASARVAIQQIRGGISRELAALREELIDFASLIELELDFAEEDVEFADRARLNTTLEKIEGILRRLIESYTLGNTIKNGIPIAIVGAPNAGKSTLLNALLKEDRAIVSEIAGTTRDTIEDEIHLGGLTFRFVDTAGLRHTEDTIEQIGIRKTYEKIDQASIVLYLIDLSDPSRDISSQIDDIRRRAGQKPVLILGNKSDHPGAHIAPEWQRDPNFMTISARHGKGLDHVQEALLSFVETSALSNNEVIVTNARHFQNLTSAAEAVDRVREGLATQLSGDFLAQDVREAMRFIGNVTGSIEIDRDVLGNLFGKFCIGK